MMPVLSVFEFWGISASRAPTPCTSAVERATSATHFIDWGFPMFIQPIIDSTNDIQIDWQKKNLKDPWNSSYVRNSVK